MKFKNLFRRNLTTEYVKRHYKYLKSELYDTYLVSTFSSDWDPYEDKLYLEDRETHFSICRGYYTSSYWVMNIEYIYQLRRVIKLYSNVSNKLTYANID